MDSWTTIYFLLSVNSQNTLHILTQNTYRIRHLITMKISIFNLYHYCNSFKRFDRLQKNHVHRLVLVKKTYISMCGMSIHFPSYMEKKIQLLRIPECNHKFITHTKSQRHVH